MAHLGTFNTGPSGDILLWPLRRCRVRSGIMDGDVPWHRPHFSWSWAAKLLVQKTKTPNCFISFIFSHLLSFVASNTPLHGW